MIEVKECSKAFGTVKAVNKATLDIGVREVFGLVGSNGAGKSTLLRMMAGIMKPDEGEIQIDGMPVYENEEAKKLFFYISDDSYFPANYTAIDLVRFYRNFYPQFRIQLFHELMDQFHLEKNRRISSFSKACLSAFTCFTSVSFIRSQFQVFAGRKLYFLYLHVG